MRLLLDANLSWRLVKKLTPVFPVVVHVKDTGLSNPAKDGDIWQWALINGFTIITNDEDFSDLSIWRGFPPKVVLIRKGNLTTAQIARILLDSSKEIEALEKSSAHGLLEIY
ncbi:MAG: DUF5615 family PIN-like protein [Haliscomenobacter sp.]|nr:DUF5615 family PIN-like protein [Haliscomenobacter sp.]